MEKNAELELNRSHIAAELSLRTLRKALSRLQLYDDSSLNEHVETVKSNLLPPERHGRGVLAFDLKSFFSQGYIQRSRVK